LRWSDEVLVLERPAKDSGSLHIPWLVDGQGVLLLRTGSLMEREEPYLLPLELARGTVCKLRSHIAEWQAAGWQLPAEVGPLAAEASRLFSAAATCQQSAASAAELADRSIQFAQGAIAALRPAFEQAAAKVRSRQAGRGVTLVGVRLNALPTAQGSDALLSAINSAAVPMVWRKVESAEGHRDWSDVDAQIEWCRASGIRICGGPLLKFDPWSVPDWLCLWEGDEESISTLASDYVGAAAARYRGKVAVWVCAARLNVSGFLRLSEHERLRLAVRTIEAIRTHDSQTPIVLSVDQPWGEFMSRQPCDFSPLHFADALVRADLGLSGVGLEINLGYEPGGTQPRDLVDFSRQLDRWSMLGMPLLVSLCAPSSAGQDSLSESSAKALASLHAVDGSGDCQAAWLERYLPVLLAKPAVQGILLGELTDGSSHDLPNSGLFDAANKPKRALQMLRGLREQFGW
jgi:hypothetical protein